MNFKGLLQSWRDALARAKAPMVLVELQDERLRIQRLGGGEALDIPMPKGLCTAGFPQEIEALGDFIGDLLVEQGWVNAVVMAALPLTGAVLRVVEPSTECAGPDQLRERLHQQQEALRLPFALVDADLDLQRIGSQPERWLMVAARQQLVEAWLRVFDLAGAQLKRLEPVQLCWLAVLETLAPSGMAMVLEEVSGGCELFVTIDQQPLYLAALPGPKEAWPEQVQQVVRGLARLGLQGEPGGFLMSTELPQAAWRQLDLPQLQRLDPYASLALAGLAQLA